MSRTGSVKSSPLLGPIPRREGNALTAPQALPSNAKPVPAKDALRTLFDAHYASIWRLLRRLGVPAPEVDDAAQEVFWVAARRVQDIQSGSEHAFLYGVALRVASNIHRAGRSVPPRNSEALDALRCTQPSPEQLTEERRERALLDLALDQLPLELRVALVLFELEGLPVKDIADLEGIPVGTAASRLRRAREEFSLIAKRLRSQLTGGRALP